MVGEEEEVNQKLSFVLVMTFLIVFGSVAWYHVGWHHGKEWALKEAGWKKATQTPTGWKIELEEK